MPSRSQLELRAAPLNILASTYPNDSQLEQVVLAAEKAMTAVAGTATTKAPSADAIHGTN
jgi:hypothetical protein